jgi:segregation and condensation protein B
MIGRCSASWPGASTSTKAEAVTTEEARAIESVLMVAQDPVEPHLLAQLLEVSPTRVDEVCAELQAAYAREERGFVLVKVAGGYRFQSHPDQAAYVERFVLEGQTARLSAAALETLAIVAYKQPLSRAQIAAIRGVNVDGVLRTLQQRGYVSEVGRDPGPGQATLFGTTPDLLERLGLDRIEDLPPIAELFPAAEVLEALELTLRARPEVDPVDDDTPTESLGTTTESFGGPAEEPIDLGTVDLETVDLGVVDLDVEPPEPEPPAWAVDPPEPPVGS